MKLPREDRLAYPAVALLCFLGTWFAELFVTLEGSVTPIWPPAGVSFAAVLIYGFRIWPAIVVGIGIAHLTVSPTDLVFGSFSVLGNTLAPILGAAYLSGHYHRDLLAVRLRNSFALLIGGTILAVVSGFVGVTGMCMSGSLPWPNFFEAWTIWMLGDLLGVMVCSPTVVSLVLSARRYFHGEKRVFAVPFAEFGLWLISMVLLAAVGIWYAQHSPYVLGLSFLPLALLVWSAMRFPPVYTYSAMTLCLIGMVILTNLGLSNIAVPISLADKTVMILFLATMSLLPQLVAAANFERQYFAAKLVYRANHDRLTGLRNRTAFEEYAASVMQESVASGEDMALCYVDVDQFKVVNDTCGHAVGDNLIRQLAAVLEDSLTQDDVIARLGGDEFAILMRNCDTEEAERRAEVLREAVEEYRFIWHNRLFAFTLTAGVVPMRADLSFTRQLSHADTACYQAKELGRNRVKMAVTGDDDLARHQAEVQWVIRINEALEQNRFRLYCQPIVPCNGGEHARHFEVLLRMVDRAGNILGPGTFIPAAERFHLMHKVDRWVVFNTLRYLEEHPACLEEVGVCSINLSGPSLGDEAFHEFVQETLHHFSVPPEKICFEVTETAAIGDLGHATRFIKTMRREGCQFALDDFGSGLASFGYLKTLHVDYLKIDGAFVRDINHAPVDLAMVKSINEVGHVMGKKTIAEYVENEAICERLRTLGVDYAQGNAMGRPIPIEQYFAA